MNNSQCIRTIASLAATTGKTLKLGALAVAAGLLVPSVSSGFMSTAQAQQFGYWGSNPSFSRVAPQGRPMGRPTIGHWGGTSSYSRVAPQGRPMGRPTIGYWGGTSSYSRVAPAPRSTSCLPPYNRYC